MMKLPLLQKKKAYHPLKKQRAVNNFLCEPCNNDLLKQKKECPNCREVENFNIINATINKQAKPKQDLEILDGLSREETELIIAEQLRIEAEINKQNIKSKQEAEQRAKEQQIKSAKEKRELLRDQINSIKEKRSN